MNEEGPTDVPTWAMFPRVCARWECGELATYWWWLFGNSRQFWCDDHAPVTAHPIPKCQSIPDKGVTR